MSYVVITKDNGEVENIIKNPTEEQKQQGAVIDNLSDAHQFIEVENKLYFIKERL